MANKRLIELANRQKNPSLPAERVQPATPVQQSSMPFSTDLSILGGDLGRKVHEEIVQRDGTGSDFITKDVNYSDDVVKGSKPGYVITVDKVLREQGLRTATPREVHQAIEGERLDLSGFYEDLGLVLYSVDSPNEYLARDLSKQIQKRRAFQCPIMIPYVGLDMEIDITAPDNYAFRLTNNTNLVSAPQLSKENNQRKFTDVDENGLPIFDDNGKYTLFTGESGLTMLIRGGYLNLGAWGRDLSNSSSSGRVIVAPQGRVSK